MSRTISSFMYLEGGYKLFEPAQNFAIDKNPQFWSNPADILALLPIQEVINLAKFHIDWEKMWIF